MKKEFCERLIKVMGEIPTLPKSVQGYGYKYCDLDTIFTVIKPILKENGMGFIQKVTTQVNGAEVQTGVETTLFDIDGNAETSFTPLPETKLKNGNEAQNMGASITYIKRYAISSILGISADEDTDGVILQKKPTEKDLFTPQMNNVDKLKTLLNKYGAKLEKNKPLIEDALNGSDGDVLAMLERTLSYLHNIGLIN